MNQQQIDIGARENTDAEMEIDLLELLAYYRERIVWIILGFLAGAVIAGLITYYLITPDYTATSKMYMVSSSSQSVVDLTDLNIGQSLSKDYVELLKTRPIIESVIEEQGLDYDYAQLLSMLSMSTLSDTRIIAIRATSKDPEEAMNIANALADKGVKELPKLMETPQPHIAEYAIIPVNPSSPSFSRNTMIGALIGMIIVLGIFTIRFMLDDTFKTAEDIEKEFGVIPLTVIPEGKIQGFDAGSSSAPKRKKKRKR
jgi:capsular polysaccharide biosynthesis protein